MESVFLPNLKILPRIPFFKNVFHFYTQSYHNNNNGAIFICYRLSKFSSCFVILWSAIVQKPLIFIVFKVNLNFLHKINCIGKVPTSIFCLLRCIFSQTKGQKGSKGCLSSIVSQYCLVKNVSTSSAVFIYSEPKLIETVERGVKHILRSCLEAGTHTVIITSSTGKSFFITITKHQITGLCFSLEPYLHT